MLEKTGAYLGREEKKELILADHKDFKKNQNVVTFGEAGSGIGFSVKNLTIDAIRKEGAILIIDPENEYKVKRK